MLRVSTRTVFIFISETGESECITQNALQAFWGRAFGGCPHNGFVLLLLNDEIIIIIKSRDDATGRNDDCFFFVFFSNVNTFS